MFYLFTHIKKKKNINIYIVTIITKYFIPNRYTNRLRFQNNNDVIFFNYKYNKHIIIHVLNYFFH